LSSPEYAKKHLGSTVHLREVLKKKLVGKLKINFWVADLCMAGDHNNDCTILERLQSLKNFSAADGVHLTKDGYRNYAKNVDGVVKEYLAGKLGRNCKNSAVASFVTGSGRTHFWRGITSPVGSKKPSPPAHQNKLY